MIWAALLALLFTTGGIMGVSPNVTDEVDNIRRAREVLDLDRVDHPLEVWLALAHVESHGQNIQDTDSYVGKLQVGDAYYQDAFEWLERHHPGVIQDYQMPTPKRGARLALRRDDELPYIVAMAYMERYASRHDHDPHRMAGMHKGGIGSAKQVKTVMRTRGLGTFEAMRYVSNTWRRSSGELIIPRLYLYVTGRARETGELVGEFRFAQALKAYAGWVEEHEGDACEPGVAPPQTLEDLLGTLAGVLGKLARGIA
jgi:hypothetical protein